MQKFAMSFSLPLKWHRSVIVETMIVETIAAKA